MRLSLLFLGLILSIQTSTFAASIYYAGQWGVGGVYKIDMDSGAVTQLASGTSIYYISPYDDDKIIVTNNDTSTIDIINADNGTVYESISTTASPWAAIQTSNHSNSLYYTSNSSGQIRSIDLTTGDDTLVTNLSHAHRIIESPTGKTYATQWVDSGSNGSSPVYELNSGSLELRSTSTYIHHLTTDSAGNIYFIAHPLWNNTLIYKIDATTYEASLFYTSSTQVAGITYDGDQDRLLYFSYNSNGLALNELTLEGASTSILTGIDIDTTGSNTGYALYFNGTSTSAVPEPLSIISLLIGCVGFAIKKMRK